MTAIKKEYHYWPSKEILIEYKENDKGKLKAGPELIPISRDKFNNPFFNLNPTNKSHWIGVGHWEREKGLKTHHYIYRGWLKDIESKKGQQIITHYVKELAKKDSQEKYIFTFNFIDIVEKNPRGDWVWINKPGKPEIYDGNN